MLIILSPAKTLKENFKPGKLDLTLPEFPAEAETLVKTLRKYSPRKLMELMDINPKLAGLNASRFSRWNSDFTPENSLPALLMFNGEVYNGLKASTLAKKDLVYAQNHLRILSGLYGVLRPLDLMKPYRLEMGTPLKVGRKKDLYSFWGDKLTACLNRELEGHKEKVLLNLASNEYSDAVNFKKIKARVLTCTFKEDRNGKLQFITLYGKKARGLMTRFIIKNRIDKAEDLKHFDLEGYFFNERMSRGDDWMFSR
jgi:uncharacterized protein